MRKLSVSASIMLAAIFFAACQKDETPAVDTITTSTVNSLPADTILNLINGQPYGAGKFSFFSIETNGAISNADSNSTKWDIGLMGTRIITNGGNSGPGSGGAFVYVGTFDELKTIPTDSVFRVDDAPKSYAIPYGSNKGWYVYDFGTALITPIPGRVLVIRTATGKYAKVEILNYYKGGTTPAANATDDEKLKKQRYYTFRFSYQSNGSKTF